MAIGSCSWRKSLTQITGITMYLLHFVQGLDSTLYFLDSLSTMNNSLPYGTLPALAGSVAYGILY